MNAAANDVFITADKPEYVLLLAEKIGGTGASNHHRDENNREHRIVQINAIHSAHT